MRTGGAAARALLAVALASLAAACERREADPRMRVVDSDATRGRQLVQAYGCVACHEMPGIREPTGKVGPPLHGLRARAYIGGRVTNRPGPLAQWIMNAPRFDPQTAMPSFRMSDQDARDIVAYLYGAS